MFALCHDALSQVAVSNLKSDLVFTKLLVEVVGSLSGCDECIEPLLAAGAALHLSTVVTSMSFPGANSESRAVLTLALEVGVVHRWCVCMFVVAGP